VSETDAEPTLELSNRLASARSRAETHWAHATDLRQQTEQVLAEKRELLQATAESRRQPQAPPADQELLHRSEYARLLARLETMPVIEQAKGIIMAQSRCTEADAFDLLRRASQRSNIPVRDLAAQIVANASQPAAEPIRTRVKDD